jgi:hypothetical protein
MKRLVYCKKTSSLPVFAFVSLQSPIKEKGKKRFFKLEHGRIGKKVKYVLAIAIIAVMLISIFAFLPKKIVTQSTVIPQSTDSTTSSPPKSGTAAQAPKEVFNTNSLISGIQSVLQAFVPQKRSGLIRSAQTINSTVWMQVAAKAWAFYRPNVGVDPYTGLPYAGSSNFRGFTDWDLGSYIQAVIDAQEIGLIKSNETWGSDARFDKVLTFLENRPLNAYGYPFQFYNATSGSEYNTASNASTEIADITDTGRLFVALNNLRNLNNALAPRINKIVLNGRSNYTALVSSIKSDSKSNSIYAYYIVSGFASFWPQQLGDAPSATLSNILNSQNITTYGVSLPNAPICNEPLLSSVFELNNSDSDRLMGLMTQVYLACEAYYNSTGRYMAPSEGSKGWGWLYEWVVTPNGETWKITDASTTFYYDDVPSVVYNKIAFSFLALYNTDYARSMVAWIEDALPDPVNGYYDGISNYGDTYVGLSNIGNTLILEAALYALQRS